MDISSWFDALGESLKTNQVTLVVLAGLAYAGYRWVSKIDQINREDHAALGEKVDEVKDAVAKGFQDHLAHWHNPPTEAVKRAPRAKKAAKKK
jgi:endonuclease V-like protein UPF0215 family